MQPGVAIIRQLSQERVDARKLESQGLKLRSAISCLPDLILSKSGNTIAFMLLSQQQDLEQDGRKRLSDMGSSFRTAYVLIAAPMSKELAPTMFELAFSKEMRGCTPIFYPQGANLTKKAVELFIILSSSADGDLAAEREASVTSATVVRSILCRIPGVPLTEPQATSLQFYGSIRDICQACTSGKLDLAQLSPRTAEKLSRFFRGL